MWTVFFLIGAKDTHLIKYLDLYGRGMSVRVCFRVSHTPANRPVSLHTAWAAIQAIHRRTICKIETCNHSSLPHNTDNNRQCFSLALLSSPIVSFSLHLKDNRLIVHSSMLLFLHQHVKSVNCVARGDGTSSWVSPTLQIVSASAFKTQMSSHPYSCWWRFLPA